MYNINDLITACIMNNIQLAKCIIDLNQFNINDHIKDILSVICFYNRYKIFTFLTNVDLNVKIENDTFLSLLCRFNRYSIIKEMLKKDDIDISYNHMSKCYYYAFKKNNIKIMKILLDKNSDIINDVSIYNEPYIIIASNDNRINTIKLLNKYNTLNINAQDKDGNTALHIACKKEYNILATELLKNKNIDVNIINKEGATCLHIVCFYNFNLDIFKQLISRDDINVNIQDEYGNTPLHIACKMNNKMILDILKKSIISITVINNYDKRPFDFIRNKNLIKWLYDNY